MQQIHDMMHVTPPPSGGLQFWVFSLGENCFFPPSAVENVGIPIHLSQPFASGFLE